MSVMITNVVRGLMFVVIAMIVADALYLPTIFAWAMLDPVEIQQALVPYIQSLDQIAFVFRWLTIAAFCGWIVAAGRNLVAAGFDDLEFSVASRVWWFFVPLANLVMPYRAMTEMWRASHGDPESDATPPLVALWWGVWLTGNIVMLIFSRFDDAEGVGPVLAIGGAKLIQAALAIALLVQITRAQGRLQIEEGELQDVFT